MRITKLSEYLTPRENRKIDKLLDRAASRMEKQLGEEAGNRVKTFLFFKCPLQKRQGDIPESHPECWKEMVELLESVWNFCQSNECCHFIRYDPETGDIDDELPFD